MALSAARPATGTLPTLESGDRLSVAEFHRRYLLRPDISRAEIVAGVVYVSSLVRLTQHGEPHGFLIGELSSYARRNAGVRHGDNVTVHLDDGEVQPDGLLRYVARRGGRSLLDAEGYVVGPPELVAEVAASSASYDLHDKKELHRRAGVREYLVWRTEDEAIDWWQLVDDEYVPIQPNDQDIIAGLAFPGFAIDVRALLRAHRAAAAEDAGGASGRRVPEDHE